MDSMTNPTSPTARRESIQSIRSRSSLQDPSTPFRQSFNNSEGLDVLSSGGIGGGGGGGMGNLADELADAWSEGEDDEYYDENNEEDTPNINIDPSQSSADPTTRTEAQRDSGVEVDPSVAPDTSKSHARNMSLSLPTNGSRHKRAGSEYDGSEYGSDSDLDSPGMPPSLVAKIDAVESLARRGTDSSPNDGVFGRVTDKLRDLGSQATVEGNAGRLITAHSATTTHLARQTKVLQGLAFPIFSPLVAPPDPEDIEELLPALLALTEAIPRPSGSAHGALAQLHGMTGDLVTTLSYLSDTLHMSRQTTTAAGRRLRSARELVAEMKREEELREEGERWLTRGNWSERLRNRECAHVCGEVVGGFEEVCNSWRARLLAQSEATVQA